MSLLAFALFASVENIPTVYLGTTTRALLPKATCLLSRSTRSSVA